MQADTIATQLTQSVATAALVTAAAATQWRPHSVT